MLKLSQWNSRYRKIAQWAVSHIFVSILDSLLSNGCGDAAKAQIEYLGWKFRVQSGHGAETSVNPAYHHEDQG
jgi:hypothetical protein